jgi:3-hydroxyisobutyryl-CoA hydrolase
MTTDGGSSVENSYNGIATHYIDSSSIPDLEGRLAELGFKDYSSLQERLAIINDTISEFATGLPHDVPMQLSGNIREAIDRIFSPKEAPNPSALLESLDRHAADKTIPSEVSQWAEKTGKTIRERSPTSVHVALRQMREGATWSIAETFQREHRIAERFMAHPDFVEGVSARLIRKPAERPKWQPDQIKDVSEDTVQEFFELPEEGERLQLLSSGATADYRHYPHAWIGLPTEQAVEARVREVPSSAADIVAYFVQASGGKEGVTAKVGEILSRKAQPDGGEQGPSARLRWRDY